MFFAFTSQSDWWSCGSWWRIWRRELFTLGKSGLQRFGSLEWALVNLHEDNSIQLSGRIFFVSSKDVINYNNLRFILVQWPSLSTIQKTPAQVRGMEEEEFEYPAPLVCERWSEIHCEKGIKARAEQSGVRLIVFWFLKSCQNIFTNKIK